MWLQPDSVAVRLDNQVLYELQTIEGPRIIWDLITHRSDTWLIKTWSKVFTISAIVQLQASDDKETMSSNYSLRWHNRVPRSMVYHLWQSVHGLSRDDLEVVENIANAFIIYIIDNTPLSGEKEYREELRRDSQPRLNLHIKMALCFFDKCFHNLF